MRDYNDERSLIDRVENAHGEHYAEKQKKAGN